MENVFIAIAVALAATAVAIFVGIVRDVSPHLSAEHRSALKHNFDNSTVRQLRTGDKAIGLAWQTHVDLFPRSRKRILFGTLVLLTALSIMAYPLWTAFGR